MSPPSWTSLPLPTPLHPLGCHRAPGWAPCIIQQIPTGWLFYIGNVYVSLPLWICPTLSIPYCVHKSVLYVFVSIAALQIGSSVPFFNDMISIFTIPLSFQVFLFITFAWAICIWNFVCVFTYWPLETPTAAPEKEKVSVIWQNWEKSNGDCIFPSILQCWRRRRKSVVVCLKGSTEKVGMRLP